MTQILTATGKRFDLYEPDADLIDPRDISHSLSNVCRFNGHTREFYSVAQHCCLVADLVPEEDKWAALLHDSTEASVGDMVRPLKEWMHAFQDVEHEIWERICTRFNLDLTLPASVYHADLVALATEAWLTYPAPDGPTRYRTPEESGMKQNITQSRPLCSAARARSTRL